MAQQQQDLPYRRRKPMPKRNELADQRFEASRSLLELRTLPIYQLPAEIMLNILRLLRLEDYPALIAANWHLLRHHVIAQNLSTPRLKQILTWPRSGFFDSYSNATTHDGGSSDRDAFIPPQMRRHLLHRLSPGADFFRDFTDMRARLRGGFQWLPWEIRDQILMSLEPTDNINLALACFRFSDRDIEWLTHEKV